MMGFDINNLCHFLSVTVGGLFMVTARQQQLAQDAEEMKTHLNTPRIIEGVLIAAASGILAAGMAIYGAQKVSEVRMGNYEQVMSRLVSSLDKIEERTRTLEIRLAQYSAVSDDVRKQLQAWLNSK